MRKGDLGLSEMTAEQVAELRQKCKAQVWPKKFKAKKK